MSAFGGKAEVFQGVAKSPLIAISGHSDEVFLCLEIERKAQKNPLEPDCPRGLIVNNVRDACGRLFQQS